MPFSSQEIENKEFVVTLRGYQKDEVRLFSAQLPPTTTLHSSRVVTRRDRAWNR